MNILCRTATLPEIHKMLDWAASEGWNPGLGDAEAFHAADPDGFFVAEVDGAFAAAISVVNHSDDFAFLGLYICRPEMRGRGVGYALWTHALAHAGKRTVGLDGVPAQEANYAKSGFLRTGQTRRLHGTLPATNLSVPIANLSGGAEIAGLDCTANGFARNRFLAAWTESSDMRKTVVLMRDGSISGVATARRCREGCKIGPVIAANVDNAFTLVLQASAAIQQTDIFVDVPEQAVAFGQVLAKNGFVETFTTARMYRGAPPEPHDSLHAIATMELG